MAWRAEGDRGPGAGAGLLVGGPERDPHAHDDGGRVRLRRHLRHTAREPGEARAPPLPGPRASLPHALRASRARPHHEPPRAPPPPSAPRTIHLPHLIILSHHYILVHIH